MNKDARRPVVAPMATPKALAYGKQTLLTALLWFVGVNPALALFAPRWGVNIAMVFGIALVIVGVLCCAVGWVQYRALVASALRDSES